MERDHTAAEDEAEIRRLVDAWAAAVRARDLDGVLARHSPDLLLFDVPPPLQGLGIDAYRRSWAPFYASFAGAVVFEVIDLRVTAGRDVAFCHGLIRCRAAEAGAAQAAPTVRLTVGWAKVDGRWTVVHEHHSEPIPNA